MPLYLNDEQIMLQEAAWGFLADQAPVSHLRRLRDENDPIGFSRHLWRQFAEMGFTGVMIAEAEGGLGLGAVEAGVILEEIGRNLTPSPFLSTAVGAAVALRHASPDLSARYLKRIAEGAATVAIAIDEGARHRPERIAMTAEREGDAFVLSGEKRMAIAAQAADLLIVAARTRSQVGDKDGITLFAVELTSAGLTIQSDRLADSSMAARVFFDGVKVAAPSVIGEVDKGWCILAEMLSHLRAGAASELIGVAAGAFERTLAYLRERSQFGRLIGEFQALQHRAAHLYSELEVARAAVLKAQQQLDVRSSDAETACLVAKAQASISATLAVQEALQMHGGIGMTDEHDIGLFMKRARVLSEIYGNADESADRLARLAGY